MFPLLTIWFLLFISVSCVIGPYPDELLNAWDDFKLKRVSENDRPDGFNDEQLFIIFEFANCGTDLENYNVLI